VTEKGWDTASLQARQGARGVYTGFPMDNNKASEAGVGPLSESGLSPEWQLLIRRLWEPDGKSLVGFLPEIVKRIKSTKRSAMAEHGLLMILHSPKVRYDPLEIEGPANIRPAHQAMKLQFDAAGLPLGKLREVASALINVLSEQVALTEGQIVAMFNRLPKTRAEAKKLGFAEALLDSFPESGPDDASTRQSRRAREKLAISRKRGRPKKNGHQ
jgi:hypothetical protein